MILAQEDVRIQRDEFVGLGDNALYIEKMKKIILSGSSKIYDSNKIISSGKQITFFIDQEKILIDSDEKDRVKTTLFINSDEDYFGLNKKE